jgi:enoyl-CoA hydratase
MTLVTTSLPEPRVLLIEIDRPDARNAINDAVAAEIAAAIDRLESDEELRVAVLAGKGRGFSSGLDLKAFLDGELGEHPERGFAGLVRRPPKKPIIAAIEGFALAGGLEMALACDLIVAAEDAKVGIPEVARGLAADGGALLRLPRRLPLNIASEMALTGMPVPVERLTGLGLINEVTAPGKAVARAVALAGVVAGNGPLGVVASKRVLAAQADWTADVAWAEQAKLLAHVWSSEDAKEGARAFAEKRAPQFSGR